ncbi:sugar phosphate isomerase/epimerase, partial [Acidobacteria bacterium AH-259-A15]|nr:sugar phosphate isomerase/epimerase [Acidobacteria bacterium AH-259-A15]
MLNRREFLAAGLGTVAALGAKLPPIRLALSGYIWQENIEEGIRTTARFGFHGIEPFRQHILKYLDKPQVLKNQLDEAGISLVTCSNGGGMSVDFIDPAKVSQTIEDHVRFARDFIAHFGCRHFKINLGRRPDNGPTHEQLKTMARALNELGKRTAQLGLRLAPHPHIWSPLEREHELKRILELTDPGFVYLVTDTAHLTLGGMNPVQVVRDHFPRVAALHFKDTPARFRGHKGATPTRDEHRKVNLYKNLGTGGVDFPAILKILRERNYQGWITLDLDPPRPGEGTIEENLQIN